MDDGPLPPASLTVFEELYPRILALVRERLAQEIKKEAGILDRRQREFLEACFADFGRTLRAVYKFGLLAELEEEVAWLVSVLQSRGLAATWAGRLLQTWTIAIQGLVRPAEAAELSRPLILAQAGAARPEGHPRTRMEEVPEDVQRYLDLALSNRRKEAADFALSFLERGQPPLRIAESLLLPALRRAGLLWERNQIDAAEEHIATEITRYVVFRVFDSLPRKKAVPYSAVLACVPDDEHDIGLALMSHCLAAEGWSVTYVGRGAPPQDLLDAVSRIRPNVIFLSISRTAHLPAAHSLILDLKPTTPDIPVIVGGAAALRASSVLEPLVAAVAASLEDGLILALRLTSSHA